MDDFPKHENPAADALAKLLLALPDLETLVESGKPPADLFWLQQLAAAGRRFRRWAD